jgi:hypothetical protein
MSVFRGERARLSITGAMVVGALALQIQGLGSDPAGLATLTDPRRLFAQLIVAYVAAFWLRLVLRGLSSAFGSDRRNTARGSSDQTLACAAHPPPEIGATASR